jgi:hypothetical protein
MERAIEIDVENELPVLEGKRFQRPVTLYAGIVDERVEAFPAIKRRSHRLLDGRAVGDVEWQREDVLRVSRRAALRLCKVDVADRDGPAVAQELLGGRPADPACAAGDESHLVAGHWGCRCREWR